MMCNVEWDKDYGFECLKRGRDYTIIICCVLNKYVAIGLEPKGIWQGVLKMLTPIRETMN